MNTNTRGDIAVDREQEWAIFERLLVPARAVLREAYTNFPSRDIEYLISQGWSIQQINTLIDRRMREDCLMAYGGSHPQAEGRPS